MGNTETEERDFHDTRMLTHIFDQRPILRRRPLRTRKPKRRPAGRHVRQGQNAERCTLSLPLSPLNSLPLSPLPPPPSPTTKLTPPLPTDHHLHRPRNPHLHLPRRHPQRQFLKHTTTSQGDDGSYAAHGGDDGCGVAGVGGFFCGCLGGFRVCVAFLSGRGGGARGEEMGVEGGDKDRGDGN